MENTNNINNSDQKIKAARTSWIGGPKNILDILFFVEEKINGVDKNGVAWIGYKGYAAIERFKNAFKCIFFPGKKQDGVVYVSFKGVLQSIDLIETDKDYKVKGYLIGTKKIVDQKLYTNYRIIIT